ncbi:MAG: hydrogenase iron-sulfur subunit [Thermodesulfobacteriota bacterium]
MSFTPDIQAFVCHYTSQQSLAEGVEQLKADGMPDGVTLNRLVCTGKLQETTLLKAFEDGADAVYVVGCPADECHNRQGSQRAAKRVLAVKKSLGEMGVEEERAEMFHSDRGFHLEFLEAAQKMHATISKLGPSPFKGVGK